MASFLAQSAFAVVNDSPGFWCGQAVFPHGRSAAQLPAFLFSPGILLQAHLVTGTGARQFSAAPELEINHGGCSSDLSGVAAWQGWASTTLCITQGGTHAWKHWVREAETINS